ncbi:unnamed protein product [Mytilus edulis]|uniref:DZIP3-like HEPN domain-containing protein n=1 Tax=Mytilus edulis TaxID=6550 RepID=A0A8S3TDH5_MYTED|nr:unnamed protein product [Mytilus edulis]
MDAEDRHRYFFVATVIWGIVPPLFRTRLENDYRSKGIGHRNAFCCKDKINCRNNSKLPLIYCQWDLLYTENPGHPGHNCHCKFKANPVQLNDLDITLASLILLNCCHLGTSEENAIRKLRRYKNDYLSQTPISMGTQIQGISSGMQMIGPQIQGISSRVQVMMPHIQGITSDIQELLSYQRNAATCQYCKKTLIEQGMDERKINSYKLGQDIFYQHGEIDLKFLLNENYIGTITDVVIMDDGRLVMCLYYQSRLLICNTDGSEEAAIPVKGIPCSITAVNNFTVAVTVFQTSINMIIDIYRRIEIYDIYNKHILKFLPVPGPCYGIIMIKNQIVLGVYRGLLIVDYLTGEILQNIETQCGPWGIHSIGDKIFFSNYFQNTNNLHWYSFTDDNIYTLTLPSVPMSMTTLRDGSLYVLCKDGSVQHVSTNGKHFKTLKTNQSQGFSDCDKIRYNSKQKKMVTLKVGILKILHEV